MAENTKEQGGAAEPSTGPRKAAGRGAKKGGAAVQSGKERAPARTAAGNGVYTTDNPGAGVKTTKP